MASSGSDNGLPIVLVTNDDGSTAPGLLALADVLILGGKCQVFVCAPDQERSGVSHSITSGENLLEAGPVGVAKGILGYEVSGSPADCVSLALTSDMFPWKVAPALVLSGINKGCSIGYHMFYSGTVAGAREAVIHGVPAMAISLHW
ncbi:hypothetical protein CBR_g41018 [Chara braunii]|uniref:Survival protein SurE-like phosphatase/nucleotidase domain-containing protein n=1 Tax=Chara braunii TaxID=69332 RepID=A0A388LV28_CHABU|nr:hypothetical protein CBR_g41018 [Chara braunii]|eukprot:GBG86115.1 hypothetical protein CBR_g41018 [Chara braunii]